MGMSSSDDEAKILEDHALLEWARDVPQSGFEYGKTPTEEELAAHERALKHWLAVRPATAKGDK